MSMREKIARAIYAAHPRNKPFDLLRPEFQDQYMTQADAVLDALMEPTKPMVFIGLDAMSRDDLDPTEDEFRAGFTAALRATKEGK